MDYDNKKGLLIVFVFLFLIGPVLAFSGSGAGTSGDPFQITNCTQLQEMQDNRTADYILNNNVDCSATSTWNTNTGFTPVGAVTDFPNDAFSGTLDGKGYVVSDLFIYRPGTDYQSVFGVLNEATVQNVSFYDVNITSDARGSGIAGYMGGGLLNNTQITGYVESDGFWNVGGIIGYLGNAGVVTNCFSNATVVGQASVGGIVSQNNNGTVSNCRFEGSVDASNVYAGGIVGWAESASIILNSYNTGSVDGGNGAVGGIVGSNAGSINNSFSTGAIGGYANIGGFVGSNSGTIGNSFSTGAITNLSAPGGGFCGADTGTISNSFWDTQTSGFSTSDGGTGKTTAQMKDFTTFDTAGWDIISVALEAKNLSYVWNIIDDSFYAFLSWSELDPPVITLSSPLNDVVFHTSDIDFTANIVDVQALGIQNVSILIDGVINQTNSSGAEGLYNFTVSGIPNGDHNWTFITYDDSDNLYETDYRDFNVWVYSGSGAGTYADPYLVTSWAQLDEMREILDASYELTADLDSLSTGYDTYASTVANAGDGWDPVGDATPFTGNFDGGNYAISDLVIDRSSETYIGLFGYASGSIIRNINLIDMDITGDERVGGLVGNAVGINISYVSVEGDVAGVEKVGGVVGYASTTTYLSYSNANIIVSCDTSAGLDCGGLIGDCSGYIDSSYSLGSVTSFTYVGGLVGDAMFSTITNSYSGADTYSTSDSNPYQGGLLGDAEFANVFNSYAFGIVNYTTIYYRTVGGLVGSNSGNGVFNDSFWDTQTSGVSDSEGGSGKTTAQMKSAITFTETDSVGLDISWDFIDNPNDDVSNEDFWHLNDSINSGYPYLLTPKDIYVRLDSPENNTASSSVKDFICFGRTSASTNLTNITLYVWNSTGSIINQTTNTITTKENQTTFSSVPFSVTDDYQWNCLATNDDGYSSFADQNYTFQVDVTNPVVNLETPIDEAWSGYDVDGATFTYNPEHASGTVDSCSLYTNSTGAWALNQTNSSITEGETNSFNLVMPNGNFLWSIECSVGAFDNFAYENRTIKVDVDFPTISNATFDSTPGTQTFSFNTTLADDNLDTCKYSILTLLGAVDGLNENISFTCNTETPATVTAYDTFTLRVYGTDLAGNENFTNTEFTITPAGTTGGGGGGSGEEVEKIPTIAIKKIDDSQRYNELQRAVLFARINNLCAILKTNEQTTFTVQDFSGDCSMKKSDLEGLRTDLATEGLPIGIEDLMQFYFQFSEQEVEQVYFSLDVIKEHDLFTSVLGIVNPMRVNPPRLDRPFIISSAPGEKNVTIEYTFTVNKDIRECAVLSGENFECVVVTNSSVKMILHIEDTDFFDKVFMGEISITSEADPNNLEVKRISLLPRVYNMSYPFFGIPAMWILIFLGIILLVLSIFFITRSRLQKELKRRFK